jgi:hypothetical protein
MTQKPIAHLTGQSISAGVPQLVSKPHFRVQMRFAIQHLYAAARFSRHVAEVEKLRGKFKPSPCFPREPVFPQAWATHACTKWAIERSIGFLREFEALAHRPARWDWADPELKA